MHATTISDGRSRCDDTCWNWATREQQNSAQPRGHHVGVRRQGHRLPLLLGLQAQVQRDHRRRGRRRQGRAEDKEAGDLGKPFTEAEHDDEWEEWVDWEKVEASTAGAGPSGA